MLVSASNHEWGSGKTYQECTDQGLTNYGRVTGRKWIGNFYANLYKCTTPTTTTTRPTTTTTRKPNWGSGTPYKECTQRGLTNYGPKTGQKWIGGAYKNLYNCTAPTTTTTRATTTTIRKPNWGSGTPYKECTQKGWTDYGRKTGQKWINGAYKDLYQCKAPATTTTTTTTTVPTTTTTTVPGTTTTTRKVDWGSGKTYKECTDQGLTDYGRKTGQRWIGDFYANLYDCKAPGATTTTTTTTPATTTTTTVPPTTTSTTTTVQTTTTTTVPVPGRPVLGSIPDLPYRGTTDVFVGVDYREEFSKTEHYYRCSAGSGTFRSADVEETATPRFSDQSGRWAESVTWEDVVTGDGPGECHGRDVSLYVRVYSDSSGWSEWVSGDASIEDAPATLHPTPVLNKPSHTSIPYNDTSQVTMTVTSTRSFNAWEYFYVCHNSYGDRHVSATGDSWPVFPTASGRTEVATWNVVTGGEDDECFSRSRAAFVLLYVRVKSATTEWSNWASHRLNIDLAPAGPVFSAGSHSGTTVKFGEEVDISARVSQSQFFTQTEHYSSCRSRDGEDVVVRGENDGRSTVHSRYAFKTLWWVVTTGDHSEECYHRNSVVLFARVLTSSGWSRWSSTTIPVGPPPCVTSVRNLSIDEQGKWFVDCTALYRKGKSGHSAKRYWIRLPNTAQYQPVAVEVSSSVDFVVTLVGGTSSTVAGKEKGVTRSAGNDEVWYSARMVKALNKSERTYTLEISTAEISATGSFSIDIQEFDLQPPTNLRADGHSPGTTAQSSVSWTPVPDATGYQVRYIEDCPPQPCLGEAWSPLQAITTNKITLITINLKVLYRIAIRSTLGSYTSDWAAPLFTYSTNRPLPPAGAVAGFRFHGVWSPPIFEYKLCSDTIPVSSVVPSPTSTSRVVNWEADIRAAISLWPMAVEGLVKVKPSIGKCKDAQGTIDLDDADENLIVVFPDGTVSTLCGGNHALACAKLRVDGDLLERVNILFPQKFATMMEKSCTSLHNGSVHEAGHALGFRSHPDNTKAVMGAPLCFPQPYDIVALKALYQSR